MRYPRTQRAIVDVIKDEMKKQGHTPASVNRLMKENAQTMGRILKLERELSTAEFIALSRLFGVRASTLMTRVERRLGADAR